MTIHRSGRYFDDFVHETPLTLQSGIAKDSITTGLVAHLEDLVDLPVVFRVKTLRIFTRLHLHRKSGNAQSPFRERYMVPFVKNEPFVRQNSFTNFPCFSLYFLDGRVGDGISLEVRKEEKIPFVFLLIRHFGEGNPGRWPPSKFAIVQVRVIITFACSHRRRGWS